MSDYYKPLMIRLKVDHAVTRELDYNAAYWEPVPEDLRGGAVYAAMVADEMNANVKYMMNDLNARKKGRCMKIRMKENHNEIQEVVAIPLRTFGEVPYVWVKSGKGVRSYYSSLEWEEVPETAWKPMAVTPISQGVLLSAMPHDEVLHQKIKLPLGIRARTASPGVIALEEQRWVPASYSVFDGLTVNVNGRNEAITLPDTVRVRRVYGGITFDKKESA